MGVWPSITELEVGMERDSINPMGGFSKWEGVCNPLAPNVPKS